MMGKRRALVNAREMYFSFEEKSQGHRTKAIARRLLLCAKIG
jgi:hypothetical protein